MSSYVFEIARRLRQSKRQDAYISFVSASSTAGIGLGCAVLILLLSVMNGFEYELRNTLLKVVPHAEIFSIDNAGLYPDPDFIKLIEDDARVDQVFVLNKTTGLLQSGKRMKALPSLIGVDANYIDYKFDNPSISEALNSAPNGIVLGKKIIQQQQLKIGDPVQLLLPSNTNDLSFKSPKSAWLTVVGQVSLGGELDNQMGLVNRDYLAELLGFDQQVTHIEIKLFDPFDAYDLVRQYGFRFNQAAYMSDWTRTNGHLYQDIQLIRTVVYIVLALVIAVACFNIVSSLVMSVKEKRKEIAILKTIGASDQNIALIFVLKGLHHGLKGAAIGTVIGVLLSLFLGDIIAFVELLLNTKVLSSDIYFTGTIPSQLKWLDVVVTVTIVVVISVLATLYPASKAARIKPADNLH
jgi:lipoprotein-releasing system permease protein